MLRTFSVLIATIAWLISRRFPKKFFIVLPITYLLDLFLIVQEARLVREVIPEGETHLGEDLTMRMMFDLLLFVCVLCPTYHYAVYIYVPGVYAALLLASV